MYVGLLTDKGKTKLSVIQATTTYDNAIDDSKENCDSVILSRSSHSDVANVIDNG